MDPQPCRNVRRLLHGKSSGRAQQGDHGDETDDCWKERSQLQRINSPVDALQLARWLRRPNPDNVDGPRPKYAEAPSSILADTARRKKRTFSTRGPSFHSMVPRLQTKSML